MLPRLLLGLILLAVIGLSCTNPQSRLAGCEALTERHCMD